MTCNLIALLLYPWAIYPMRFNCIKLASRTVWDSNSFTSKFHNTAQWYTAWYSRMAGLNWLYHLTPLPSVSHSKTHFYGYHLWWLFSSLNWYIHKYIWVVQIIKTKTQKMSGNRTLITPSPPLYTFSMLASHLLMYRVFQNRTGRHLTT